MSSKKVIVLGGGIAGMSAAHELVERGFSVEVFDRKTVPGGKARSLPAVGPSFVFPAFTQRASGSSPGNGAPLPGEHGFRFFPGFYKHIVDTMARIPYRGGRVSENLVEAPEVLFASFDRPPYRLPARYPGDSAELKGSVYQLIALLAGDSGVPVPDAAFFAGRIWQFLTSCPERRAFEYERVSWWDFVGAESRSLSYRKFFADGITRSLVAAKARRASAKTIGNIFDQMLFSLLLPDGVPADRLLNGPTNDVWLDPWLAYLRERGVVYHTECDVVALHCQGGSLRGATVSQRGITKEISGDYFVAALPVERMVELVTPELLASDPSLANLRELGRCVEWMNGIQFYLTERVPIAKGHVIYIDSPWALTSVSQAHFWREFPLESYADGRVVEVLSVDISDWDMPGLNGKAAKHCTKRQIALETWEQLKKSLNPARDVLQDRQLHSWFLDPGIDDRAVVAGSSRTAQCTNAEPLLVNYVDTWRLRPEAITRIRNLFLASDYVRTHTDLATMEAANEAARRAVNGILRAAHSDASPCALWDLHEPEAFIPLRAYDRQRFRRGLAWDGEALAFSESVARLSSPHRLNEHAGVASSASYANFARTPHEGVLRGLRIRSNS